MGPFSRCSTDPNLGPSPRSGQSVAGIASLAVNGKSVKPKIENGYAVETAAGSGVWVYTVTASMPGGSKVGINVVATDFPGGTAIESNTKTI